MVAIVSRRAAGLVKPREVSRNIQPAKGGVAIHWAGERQDIGPHAQCVSRWKQWQGFHMNERGWADIAYNWGVCDHGYLFVGRGWGIRSAANGTDDANDRYLAACWIGGEGEQPTALALATFEALIQDCRRRGAGHDVQPHSHFYGTACPGPVLAAHATVWRRMVSPGTASCPPEIAPRWPLAAGRYFGPGGIEKSALLRPWQRQMKIADDGDYGPITAATARLLQRHHGLAQDGLIGPRTWAAAWRRK